jgi:glycosyltransferase involved in cell wall biosynthesis
MTARVTRSSPKVSVLIPTFNRASFLPAAVESVLQQTYADYEIVIVDDGSTDDTKVALGPYLDKVRYIYCSRGGPAHARNVAFENAVGQYLCLLDSDDLYYEHKLELEVDHLERYPDSVMVYTDFSAFDDEGFSREFHLRHYHRSAYRHAACHYDALFDEQRPLSENNVVRKAAVRLNAPHWLRRNEYRGNIYAAYLRNTIVFTNSIMLRREALESAGPQRPYFGHFHDLEFALRLCRLGKIGFIDNPTYKLRVHPGQISAIKKADGGLNAVKLQRDLLRVARKHALGSLQKAPDVGAVVGRLSRAAAQPLLAYDGPDPLRRRLYPRKARRYLAFSEKHGYSQRSLYLVSFLPALLRRLYFAFDRRMRTIGAWLAETPR